MSLRIKEILKDNKISQAEIARRMGVSSQMLNYHLKNPKHSVLEEISNAIGCEIFELFEPGPGYAHWYDKGIWLGVRKI